MSIHKETRNKRQTKGDKRFEGGILVSFNAFAIKKSTAFYLAKLIHTLFMPNHLKSNILVYVLDKG